MTKQTTKPTPVGTTVVAGVARENPVLTTVSTAIPIPAAAGRNRKSSYDVSLLTEVGMSFGVKNKTKKQVGPIIHRINRQNTVEITDLASGVVVSKATKPHYVVHDVDPNTDPDGAQVRVFRTA